ncbi:MAG: IS1380 family transposase [Patescibacteria group bacterium]|nr:IS1380 family transposase [Patescibacteria group bacterium]
MTDCKSHQMEFQGLGRRRVVADFNGGNVTSDAGGLLLREAARGSKLIERFARCFTDYRNEDLIEFSVVDLIGQRTIAMALGYEDLNDHDHLRRDPLLAVLAEKYDVLGESREKSRDRGCALAGKSTLNRFELTPADADADSRYKKIVYNGKAIEDFFVEWYVDRQPEPPKVICIDLDATDDPTHGNQEGSYFHGYYDHYCYLPLYMFVGDDLLSARLRSSECDPLEGVIEDLARIIEKIRARFPRARIIVRGDSGFCREDLMSWCEARGVDYVLGLAQNTRLLDMIKKAMKKAKRKFKRTGEPAKIYRNLKYRTLKTWSRKRRVVAKAEHLDKGANPRFVVTTIDAEEEGARSLYEDNYCARGNMENRIKEQQMGLFADRTSTHTMRANQLRLWLSSLAYVLVTELRRVGLKKTAMETAQSWTIREKLFKIGAVVTVSVRRIMVQMSSAFPWKGVYEACLANLQEHYGTG